MFRVLLSCRDCSNGEDPQGCFDGGTEFVSDAQGEPIQFETVVLARVAGYKATKDCGPWEFEVLDGDGEEASD